MFECLHNLADARKLKRELVSSLLTDPAWKVSPTRPDRLAKGCDEARVEVCIADGTVFVNGAELPYPVIARCCIRRAARTALRKRLGAVL